MQSPKTFLNTLTADEKYSLDSRDNSMQTIQMHFSEKQKTFSELFPYIFLIYIKFWTFSKKDDSHSLWISEITDTEIRG